MNKRQEFENAFADIFQFDNGTEVCEYHVMLHVTSSRLSFDQQLEAILSAYNQLLEGTLQGAQAVFKRYFLSDAANQADDVIVADVTDCAKSIIQQAPLDGTKIALWVYLMTNVQTGIGKSGLYEVRHGAFRHLWNGSAHNMAANSEYQTRLLFNEYNMQLIQEGCTLEANCIRTWFFVNDVDLNYGGVVRARNQFFFTQGLTVNTHFIASTGIGGRQQDPNVLSQMDNYAIAGVKKEQIHYLYASTHLNRTSDYGVSFERGTQVNYADRRHVFISGTASINNKGEVVYPKDIIRQTRRMWENVEALLAEADCNFNDVAEMVVYLRDTADYELVRELYEERFAGKPYVIVHAPVCRPGWLIEMECMAVKAVVKGYSDMMTSMNLKRLALLLYFTFLPFYFFTSVSARSIQTINADKAREVAREQVVWKGRLCPFSTFALDFLESVYGRSSYKGLSPEQVVYGWLLRPEVWKDEPMIHIPDANLRQQLNISGEYAKFSELFDDTLGYKLNTIDSDLPERLRQLAREAPAAVNLDEKVGEIILLTKGELIQPRPADLEPLPSWRIDLEILWNNTPSWVFLILIVIVIAILWRVVKS